MIDLDIINRLTGGRLGTFDTVCPLCSASRHTPTNRRAKVFRVWRTGHRFASYHCVHCEARGYARDQSSPRPDPLDFAKARAEAEERDRIYKADRLAKARWLWSRRRPIAGTIAETYLRLARGYGGPLPATLGFLWANPAKGYPPAMIAAFGLAHETEPGVIKIAEAAVRGVHLTCLLPDGSDRARGEQAKFMIGSSAGWPIVLAPPNDLLALAITEGIEDGLSVYEATGFGVWAAGCASRMPAIAGAIPRCIECVNIVADEDASGRRFAVELAKRLAVRAIHTRITLPGIWSVGP
jgi:hypothetical protein